MPETVDQWVLPGHDVEERGRAPNRATGPFGGAPMPIVAVVTVIGRQAATMLPGDLA